MKAHRHIQEIVEPYFIPYLRTVPNPILEQDNARLHVDRLTMNYSEMAINILLRLVR